MLPQKLRLSLAIFLTFVLSLFQPPLLLAEPSPVNCTVILEKPSSGAETVSLLGSNIGFAAANNSLTVQQLINLLTNNPTFHLDMCGYGFYAESMIVPQMSPLPAEDLYQPGSIATKTTLKSNGITTDYKSVFKLHSNPGSKKTIYLDFDGEKIENTAWNKNFNSGITWTASGFSQDSDFSKFSESELDIIQSVWQRVAEDFSPFDVDVTTELPPVGSLERTNASDDIFGTRALISNDTVIFNACKCSGLAYVGVFDDIGNLHDINQPAWIFTQGVGDNPKYIAEAVTHEVGHTLGLSHDGSRTVTYFPGINGWAPIMGVGFYQPITQWSKGEYIDANNPEDDLEIIFSHGLKLRADEDENTEKTARIIIENQALGGVISTSKDLDFFTFTATSTSEFTIEANTATLSPDLDVKLTIYPVMTPVNKTVLNPPLTVISTDIIDGLSVKSSMILNKGITYMIVLEGAPVPLNSSSLESSYGSIGTYKLTIKKGKMTPEATSEPSNTKSEEKSLPDKLVLPQPSNSPAPLELPSQTKFQLRNGFRGLIAI